MITFNHIIKDKNQEYDQIDQLHGIDKPIHHSLLYRFHPNAMNIDL